MKPKRAQTRAEPPCPVQLALFADAASLVHVRLEINQWRSYRLEVWPDLFSRVALNALAQIASAKRRRGYQDRTL